MKAQRSPRVRLPFRYKGKNGNEIGSYYIRIDGKDVNLRTQDGDEALRRMKRALTKGERKFVDDGGRKAARVVADALAGTGGAQTAPVVEPPRPAAPESSQPPAAPAPASSPAHTAAAALPPLLGPSADATSSSSAPPKPKPVHPDGYIPPPPGWGAAASAAAAAASGAERDAEAAAIEDELGQKITPEMMDDIIDQAADYAVMLQLLGQAWLGAHAKPVLGANIEVAPVPDTAKGIKIGKHIWKRWFKGLVARYLPSLDAPDWVLAPLMVASLTLPIQFGKDAKVMPDKPENQETPAAPAAPAAA